MRYVFLGLGLLAGSLVTALAFTLGPDFGDEPQSDTPNACRIYTRVLQDAFDPLDAAGNPVTAETAGPLHSLDVIEQWLDIQKKACD